MGIPPSRTTFRTDSPTGPMNVLLCLHQYHPARGGAETLMKGIADRLAARGHSVRVLATTAASTEAYFVKGKKKSESSVAAAGTETVDGVSVTRVTFRRFGAPVLNALRSVAWRVPIPGREFWRMISWGPRSRPYYKEILAAESLDVLVAGPLPMLNVWYARRAARKRRIPLVIVPCFHTEDRYSFHNKRYYRWLREADAVVCLTELEKEFLHDVVGMPLERMTVIGVGLDGGDDGGPGAGPDEAAFDAARAEVRSKYNLTAKDIVLFIGQHAAHKGIITLVEAMEFLWKENGRDADLLIAGNPTSHTVEIEACIAKLPDTLKGRIRLIKGIAEDEKIRLLRAADVFVSVSPYESFGIVFLEAWREKRAVIGCVRGGSSRLIEPFVDGLCVHDQNYLELAGAIGELLDDPAYRARLGERGLKKMRERYSWTAIIDLWEHLLKGMRT